MLILCRLESLFKSDSPILTAYKAHFPCLQRLALAIAQTTMLPVCLLIFYSADRKILTCD